MKKLGVPVLRRGPCSLPEDTYSIPAICDKDVKESSTNCERNRNKLWRNGVLRQKTTGFFLECNAKKRRICYHGSNIAQGRQALAAPP